MFIKQASWQRTTQCFGLELQGRAALYIHPVWPPVQSIKLQRLAANSISKCILCHYFCISYACLITSHPVHLCFWHFKSATSDLNAEEAEVITTIRPILVSCFFMLVLNWAEVSLWKIRWRAAACGSVITLGRGCLNPTGYLAISCCGPNCLSNMKNWTVSIKTPQYLVLLLPVKTWKTYILQMSVNKNQPKGEEVGSFHTFAFLYIYNLSVVKVDVGWSEKPQGAITFLSILCCLKLSCGSFAEL